MISLGIRAESKQAIFAIYDNETNSILNIEKIVLPSVLSTPEQLKFARNSILDILREYNVCAAGVRVAEGNSQNKDSDRLYLESVFMESFASSDIDSYYIGRKTGISASLKITNQKFDDLVKGSENLEIPGWPKVKSKPIREAVLVAMAACA